MSNPLALQIVKYLRRCDPYHRIKHSSNTIYAVMSATFLIYFNHLQYQRMLKLYPEYDDIKNTSGAMLVSTKEQELADVVGYTYEVESMRKELRSKTNRG